MKLTPEEMTYLRSYFSRSNRYWRFAAWGIFFLATVLAVFILLAFVKSSFEGLILLSGIIVLVPSFFLVHYLFTYSGNTDSMEMPSDKEKISGTLRVVYNGYKWSEMRFYIDDHRVIFLERWVHKGYIKEGDYLEAWAVPMRYKEIFIISGHLYLILSVEGKCSITGGADPNGLKN